MKITKKLLKKLIKEEYTALVEGEGKIVCPNCGHHNEAGVDKCSKCGHPRNKGSWKPAKEEKLNEEPGLAAAALLNTPMGKRMRNKTAEYFGTRIDDATTMARQNQIAIARLKKEIAQLKQLIASKG